jgi:hypothetical protein
LHGFLLVFRNTKTFTGLLQEGFNERFKSCLAGLNDMFHHPLDGVRRTEFSGFKGFFDLFPLEENTALFFGSGKDFKTDIIKPGISGQNKSYFAFSVNIDIILISGRKFVGMLSGFILECDDKAGVVSFGVKHLPEIFFADPVIMDFSHGCYLH